MNKKAQTQIEAVICLTIFLAILGQAMATMNQTNALSKEATDSVTAKTRAQACCILADTVYTTNATITGKMAKCETKEQTIQSTQGKQTKNCKALSKKIKMVQSGEKTTMEVTANEHYK